MGGAERRRCVVLLVLVLGLPASPGAGAQEATDYAALGSVRVRLDRDLSELQRSVWIHSGSLAAGAVGYVTGGVALVTLATMALTQVGGGAGLDLPIAISGAASGSGFLLGITGTTVATWRSRNTTRRFDRALVRTTAVRD